MTPVDNCETLARVVDESHIRPTPHNSHGTAVPMDTVSVTSKYSGAPRPQPKGHTMSENIEDLKAQLAAAEAAAKAAEAEAARAKAEALRLQLEAQGGSAANPPAAAAEAEAAEAAEDVAEVAEAVEAAE